MEIAKPKLGTDGGGGTLGLLSTLDADVWLLRLSNA